jgi:hypothetical protein
LSLLPFFVGFLGALIGLFLAVPALGGEGDSRSGPISFLTLGMIALLPVFFVLSEALRRREMSRRKRVRNLTDIHDAAMREVVRNIAIGQKLLDGFVDSPGSQRSVRRRG